VLELADFPRKTSLYHAVILVFSTASETTFDKVRKYTPPRAWLIALVGTTTDIDPQHVSHVQGCELARSRRAQHFHFSPLHMRRVHEPFECLIHQFLRQEQDE
jgi:hypothetical protein